MRRISSLNGAFLIFVAAGFLTILLAGCNRSAPASPKGPTENEVRDRYRRRFAELGRHLMAIAGKLPPAGSVKKVSAPVTLDPPPVFFEDEEFEVRDAGYKTAANTGFLSFEELSNVEGKPDLWLGPQDHVNYPRANLRELKKTYDGDDKDGILARDFETGLALRYLIVYRITKLVRPGLTFGEKMGFTPGSVDMEVFLVDLKTDEVAASFPVSAKTPKELTIRISRDPKEHDTENPVVRSLEGDARTQIFKNLAATTRGKFEQYPPR
jgi:hypothetical protein